VRKRTVTTIETHQIVFVRHIASATLGWCPACLNKVEMTSIEDAALVTGLSLRDLCSRVSEGDIHLVETVNGSLLCANSLLNKVSLGARRLKLDGAPTPE
jgi:hypothetical protein